MQLYENLYCKMFLDTNYKIEELIDTLLVITNGQKKLTRTIVTQFGEIDINLNKEFSIDKIKNKFDGFLYFKYFLDIESNKEIEQEIYISRISEIITFLRSKNIKVVAACDFEEELPLND